MVMVQDYDDADRYASLYGREVFLLGGRVPVGNQAYYVPQTQVVYTPVLGDVGATALGTADIAAAPPTAEKEEWFSKNKLYILVGGTLLLALVWMWSKKKGKGKGGV